MTRRERVLRILEGKDVDRSAYWIGDPTYKACKKYKKYFKVRSKKQLGEKLGDDLIWVRPDIYVNPKGMWNTLGNQKRTSLSQPGVFAETEDVADIINYPYWPDLKYMNYSYTTKALKKARKKEMAVFSGMWAPVWHLLMDFFGMEECFIKMYTHPEQIHATMKIMTDFYLQANKKLFDRDAELIDVMFFGNDIGSQLDTMISPEMYEEFIFPYFRQLIDQAKGYGLKVALHSCGSIERIIPDIINMNVDILHPIQAKAVNMDADTLQSKYGGQIVFMGGVDTQELLPFGTPEQVEAEVYRLRNTFGKHFICSPSHEALLENVSPENLLAMSRAATKIID